MRRVSALIGLLVLSGCSPGSEKQKESVAGAWENGESVNADGARFRMLCFDGEWSIGLKTIERLVPPEADRQWVNRDVAFQFDDGPVERTKGTLNENRLDLRQSDEGSTVDLNYGQDVAAGLIRGSHRTLTIRTNDGANRPKEWRFDVTDAQSHIQNDKRLPCPMMGAKNAAN